MRSNIRTEEINKIPAIRKKYTAHPSRNRLIIPPLLLLFSLLVFIIFISVSGCQDDKSANPPPEKKLFERDLQALVDEGYLVLTDENESDIFIQEDIYSTDYETMTDLASIKAENLGMPLYIESKQTYGNPDYIEEVRPIDRKAKQDFYIIEVRLLDPSYFDEENYLDDNYNRAEALNKKLVVAEMLNFIDRYPDSIWVYRALSYIEYEVCAVERDPDKAIKIYDDIDKKYGIQYNLTEILNEYKERAKKYKEEYQKESVLP